MNDQEKLPTLLGQPSLKFIVVGAIIAQVILVIFGFIASLWLGFVMLLILAITWTLFYLFLQKYEESLDQYIKNLTYRANRGEQEALVKMPLGIILYNEDYEIEWVNPYLQSQLTESEASILGKNLEDVHSELYEIISEDKDVKTLQWDNLTFNIRLEDNIKAIYLLDVTKYEVMQNHYNHYKPVIGWMFLDNYDEVTKNLDDRGISALNSMLTTYFSNWSKQHGVFYKKIETDKYLILFSYNELKRLESNKFSIIDNIRDRTSSRNLPLTISIGVSYGEESFYNLADLAQKNLDLALGRGGDQAVVKEVDEEPRYYGGKTDPTEKRTRVRSRMISQSVQEQIIQADKVFIMGHVNPDLDAIGSSLGIARIAMMLDQEAHVVIDQTELAGDIQKLLEEVKKFPETYDNIVSPKEAEKIIDDDDLVILVDHHKPSLSIAPNLLNKTKKNLIIDHHRRGEEFTFKPLIAYIEPYASSTAELVTEFFEYIPNEGLNPINKAEATAMLGGIIVDTNNFTSRTGSRTFESASFLQSVGASIKLIQRILKEEPENYQIRGQLIQTFEFVEPGYAVVIGDDDKIIHPVTAAQTADTMLDITGVEASFAIIRRDTDTVGISARSLGDINVQRIMEEMGGGGHLTNAATQIDHKTVGEVLEELKKVIQETKD